MMHQQQQKNRTLFILLGVFLVIGFFLFSPSGKSDTRLSRPIHDQSNKENSCPWEFVSYTSSAWEQQWYDHVDEWGAEPCARYDKDNNRQLAHKWVDYAEKHQNVRNTENPDETIFSTFSFRKTCTGELVHSHIEPLALVTRHPYFCEDLMKWVTEKGYLFLDWRIGEQVKENNGKVYYFDCGASTWTSGAGGASQSWLVEMLEIRGLSVDGIWAWEAKQWDPNRK